MSTCGHCPATWTGLGMAHCSRCHRTFTRVGNFDRHRTATRARGDGAACVDPVEVGLVLTDRGYYGMPADPDRAYPETAKGARQLTSGRAPVTTPLTGDMQ